MGLSITNIREAISPEWDKTWRDCGYSTYFHSREWAEIWAEYTGGIISPFPVFIDFSDRKKALLPFSAVKILRGFSRKYISSPAGTYGGWISSDDLSADHAGLMLEYVFSRSKNLEWRVNPYDPHIEVLSGLKGAVNGHTRVMELEEGFEPVCKKWSKGHYSAAKKADREGVVVRISEDMRQWKEYFEAYKESIERWGEKTTSKYKWDLFESLFRRCSENIKLWTAEYGGKVIAGALCFYAGAHVVYWHGAARAEYFKLRPVNLIIYEAVKHACENGFRWFDLNPSGGHEKVEDFKKHFGSIEKPCPVIIRKSSIYKLLEKIQG